MDKSMYGKMSDDRRTKESPTCGLTNKPTKEGLMTEIEQKVIEKIRLSKHPDKMMEYMEEILFNPQKFQEALEMPSALPVF